jgi:hypothetical protein
MMPQRPEYEDEKTVIYRTNGEPRKYEIEDVVVRSMCGDANCREWLHGRTRAPELPPLNPETHAICCKPNCPHDGKPQPLKAFYRNHKKRNGRSSECSTCANRRRLIRYHNGKIPSSLRRL